MAPGTVGASTLTDYYYSTRELYYWYRWYWIFRVLPPSMYQCMEDYVLERYWSPRPLSTVVVLVVLYSSTTVPDIALFSTLNNTVVELQVLVCHTGHTQHPDCRDMIPDTWYLLYKYKLQVNMQLFLLSRPVSVPSAKTLGGLRMHRLPFGCEGNSRLTTYNSQLEPVTAVLQLIQ